MLPRADLESIVMELQRELEERDGLLARIDLSSVTSSVISEAGFNCYNLLCPRLPLRDVPRAGVSPG